MPAILDKNGKKAFSVTKKYLAWSEQIRKKLWEKNDDYWILVIGKTGSGKSYAAMKLAYMIDPEFSHENLAYTFQEYMKAGRKGKQGQVLVLDEAISLFFGRDSMSSKGKSVIEYMLKCRKKNMCYILCCPDALLLQKPLLKKINAVIYCWEDNIEGKDYKGHQEVFINFKRKKKAYEYTRWLWFKENRPDKYLKKPGYSIRMQGDPLTKKVWLPMPESLYLEISKRDLRRHEEQFDPNKGKEEENPKFPHFSQRNKAILVLKEETGLSNTEISELLSMPRTSINEAIRRARLN